MTRKLRTILTANFLLCLMYLGDSHAQPNAEIRIGVMAPLTGDYAFAGEEITRGITLAQEQLRTEDISVKISFENACLPAQGVSALRKMIDQDKIEAIAANYCVITLQAIRPIIEKQKLITFQNSSVPADLIGSSPFIFSTWPTIEQEVEAIARTLRALVYRPVTTGSYLSSWLRH